MKSARDRCLSLSLSLSHSLPIILSDDCRFDIGRKRERTIARFKKKIAFATVWIETVSYDLLVTHTILLHYFAYSQS